MNKKLLILTLTLGLAANYTTAAEKTAQQQKMTQCNQQASSQSLKGDARRSFMSGCLKKSSTIKPLTAQQQKMKNCNAQAKTKNLAGAEHRNFMSSCLKKG